MTNRPPATGAGTVAPPASASRDAGDPEADRSYPDPGLLRLLCDDRASVRRLVATLVEVTRADLSRLRRASRGRDVVALETTLHRILGGLATLGRCRPIDQGRDCLEALRSRRIAADDGELAILARRLQALIDDLDARLDRDALPPGRSRAA